MAASRSAACGLVAGPPGVVQAAVALGGLGGADHDRQAFWHQRAEPYYALLMVSRFREAIAAGHDGPVASVIAARQAGRTLFISASTVAIGFLALLTVPISEIRSIGIAGFLVAGISVLLTNTLVPAVLALLGPRIDAGRMPFTPKLDPDRAAQTGTAGGDGGR